MWFVASTASTSTLRSEGGHGLPKRSTGHVGPADTVPWRPVTGPAEREGAVEDEGNGDRLGDGAGWNDEVGLGREVALGERPGGSGAVLAGDDEVVAVTPGETPAVVGGLAARPQAPRA